MERTHCSEEKVLRGTTVGVESTGRLRVIGREAGVVMRVAIGETERRR